MEAKDIVLLGGIMLATAGAATTGLSLVKGMQAMEGQHWIMLLVVLVAGYVLGRIWVTPAQMIGLP
jgi:hypothetical protein